MHLRILFVSDALNNYLDQQIIAHYQAKSKPRKTPKKWLNFKKNGKEKPRISEKGSNPGLDPFSETQKQRKKPDKSYF